MFIAMNRFRIAPGREAEFIEVWRQRATTFALVVGGRHMAPKVRQVEVQKGLTVRTIQSPPSNSHH
jgi:heme-degrading monooxygenase HmoA